MDLRNLVEIVVNYLLIKGIIYLSCRDEFLVVNTLVCMVTNYIRLTVNHNVRLLVVMIYQATILHRILTLRGY